jgi:dienelactone hydrolase
MHKEAIFTTLLRTLLMSVLILAMPTTHAESPASERITFDSYTPPTMFDLARERRQNWTPQKIWADLKLPAASGKVPAMILMHGSAGVEGNTRMWVDALNGIGVATLVVDTFGPRGVTSTVADQTLLSPAANLIDAFQALQLLAADPRIDADRIGVMGFSRGGSVAFRTAIEPLRHAVIKSDVKFALHIPVYAGCNQVYWSPRLTGGPILNLLGAADDYTGAESCEQLAAQYETAGASIRTIKYANAYHSFDATYPLHILPKAPSAIPCGTVQWDIASWTIHSELTGADLAPAALPDFFKKCTRYGLHVGRNTAAAVQARSDVLAFVQQVFFNAK